MKLKVQLLRKFRIPAGLFILLSSMIFSGCFKHFYSTNTVSQIDSATLLNLINAKKFFVLHEPSQNKEFAITNLKVVNDTLEADHDSTALLIFKYQHPIGPTHNVFPAQDSYFVLYDVHLYSKYHIKDEFHVSIPLKDFYRVDVYGLDKSSTNTSTVISIAGLAVTAVAITAIIIQATKPPPVPVYQQPSISCSPQVYLTEIQQPKLQGTLYSGAIYASLERTDYLPLTLAQTEADKVRITIKANEVENVLLNQVHLMQVTHNKNEHALVDRKGKVLMYKDPVIPAKANIGDNQDVLPEIRVRDGKYYSFTNHTDGEYSSDVVLDFKKPRGSTTGKLIVHAKNSPWSNYLFGQFKSLYGDSYQSMIRRKDKVEHSKVLQCELDQYLPLIVSVKYKEGWKMVDYFLTSGTSKLRDQIMSLDLAEFRNSDHVRVRLQTTYLFWDLDYVGMDFSTKDLFQTQFIAASREYKKNHDTETVISLAGDTSYVDISGQEQLNLEFTIKASPGTGLKNSYFLAGNGYYHDNSLFEGKARLAELSRFTGKGAFDKYSREKFDGLFNVISDNGKNETVTIK